MSYPYRKKRSATESDFSDGTVTVYEDDGSTKATIYSDKYGISTKSNPITIDSSGNYSYHADADNIYVEELTSGKRTIKKGVALNPDKAWMQQPDREKEWGLEPFSLVRTKRSSVTVSAASTEENTVNWDTDFPDTNYTLSVVVKSDAGSLGSSLTLVRITSITKSSVKVAIENSDTSQLSGTVHAVAIHDEALT